MVQYETCLADQTQQSQGLFRTHDMGLYDGVLHFIPFCESRCTTKHLPASEEPVLVSMLLTTSSLTATHVVTPRLSSFIRRLSIFECLLEVSNQNVQKLEVLYKAVESNLSAPRLSHHIIISRFYR